MIEVSKLVASWRALTEGADSGDAQALNLCAAELEAALATPPAAPDEAMVRDAMRYRHCRAHGFPVRNQNGGWIAFSAAGNVVMAESATLAIDAALTGDKA